MFYSFLSQVNGIKAKYDSNFDRSAKSTATVWLALFLAGFVAKSLSPNDLGDSDSVSSFKRHLRYLTIIHRMNGLISLSGRSRMYGSSVQNKILC